MFNRVFCGLTGLMFICQGVAAPVDDAREANRLPRTNLMVYHSVSGKELPATTRKHWQQRRSEVLRGMQEIMGPLPGKEKRCPLDVTIEEELDRGTFVQRLISYSPDPGSRVPAFLLIPKSVLTTKAKAPAILALHSTDAVHGHRVLVEDLRPSYRAFGRDLAERGYVVLAPAYPHLANYAPDLEGLVYQSGTMKTIWDNIRGLDLLQTMPQVKRDRIGALGHSLGGHNAIYTAVFDDRIKVVVSSCGFDSYLHYMNGIITGWTSARYMPKLAEYNTQLHEIPFDFHELIGALAPRPFFVNAPLGDTNFQWKSVDEIIAAARPVYRLYNAEDRLRVEHPDSGHDFPQEVRERAYEFLDEWLKRK
jgi:dienelactone hydrolase